MEPTTTTTNSTWFCVVADGVITAAGERWYSVSYPDLKEGTRKTVQFGYHALRGMTDNGQPGWDDYSGDKFGKNNIEEAFRLANKCLVAGPFFKVDTETIRVIRHDETVTTTRSTHEFPTDSNEFF